MSQYKKKKTNTQNYELLHGNYALILLLIAAFLVPLVTRLYRYDPNLSQFNWFIESDEEIDVFLYWKSRILTLLGALMGLVLIYKFTNRKFRQAQKKNIWVYPLAAYGVLTLLSTLFSEYRSFGFSGIHEQFESVWVILTYCVLTFFAYTVVQNAADITSLRRALFALFAVLCVLGITQLTGHDFWESKLGLQIMVPEKYAAYRESLQFNFSNSGVHQVYLTFYNPNYVGMFASLVLPFSVFCIFSVRKWWQKILWTAVSVGLLVCTFNSGSKTFLISIVISIVVALVFCRRAIWRRILFVIPVCVALFFAGKAYFKHINLDPVQYVKNAVTLNKNDYLLNDIRFSEKDVTIEYNNAELHVMYAANELGALLICQDKNGGTLEYTVRDDQYIELADPTFSGILFRFTQGNAFYPWLVSIHIRGCAVYFTQTENGYQYINNVGKFADAIKAPAALFSDYDRFASGRGYLWSRSIPLLRQSLVLGTGADSFSLVFPHNDLAGRVNAGYYTALVTKPHNLYLQIGVQHGVLALVCLLAVCAIYLVQSFLLYWKTKLTDEHSWLGVGIMIGVIGYLIAGLSNDSCVATAPLFWILLGTGFALNRINREAARAAKAAEAAEAAGTAGKDGRTALASGQAADEKDVKQGKNSKNGGSGKNASFAKKNVGTEKRSAKNTKTEHDKTGNAKVEEARPDDTAPENIGSNSGGLNDKKKKIAKNNSQGKQKQQKK